MKILALIPARSGSKRIPNKNIRLLGGKPLIVWTIEMALKISGICDVLVSTDSLEIQAISSTAGASVPWLRPSKFATDGASSVDVAIHAIDRYEKDHGKVDGLLLLQPTSPFRTPEYTERGIEKFLDYSGDSVIGVSPIRERPSWMVAIENNVIKPMNVRSDDIDNAIQYIVNGSFYLTSPLTLRTQSSFYSSNSRPLICNSIIETIDIDTEADLEIAQVIKNTGIY